MIRVRQAHRHTGGSTGYAALPHASSPKAAVHRVPRPCPPRRREPYPARAAKGGAACGGACGPRWAGDTAPKARSGRWICGPRARPRPGGRTAALESAIVTSPKFQALSSSNQLNFRGYSEISGVSVWLQPDRVDQGERVALLGVERGVDREGALVRVGIGATAGVANEGRELVQ